MQWEKGQDPELPPITPVFQSKESVEKRNVRINLYPVPLGMLLSPPGPQVLLLVPCPSSDVPAPGSFL